MEVRSVYKYARISPKKARDVAREIQGLPVSDAIDTLNFTPKKAAFLIGKTLKSAVANAENNHDLAADSLHVKEANVSEGPSFRRFKPRARGSASAIRKRTSHIYIILTDEVEVEEKPARDRKPQAKKEPATAAEVEEVAEESSPAKEPETPASEVASEDLEAAADESAVDEASTGELEAPEMAVPAEDEDATAEEASKEEPAADEQDEENKKED